LPLEGRGSWKHGDLVYKFANGAAEHIELLAMLFFVFDYLGLAVPIRDR
jgi:hypothetical protein